MWQPFLQAYQDNVWLTAATVFLATILILWIKNLITYRAPEPLVYMPKQIGDISLQSLRKYDGRDPFMPLLLAVRGKVYDVTEGKDFYGVGGGYHVFAGKECSRALAKMKISAEDCNDLLSDCTVREMETLKDWETRFAEKYGIVGQIVPLKDFTMKELAQYDGSNPSKPILLAIRGVVFDVSTGAVFYGPDGVYPFAGKECAFAFAKVSTEVEDCHSNLEDLSKAEEETLLEWEAKFEFKYPIIGEVTD